MNALKHVNRGLFASLVITSLAACGGGGGSKGGGGSRTTPMASPTPITSPTPGAATQTPTPTTTAPGTATPDPSPTPAVESPAPMPTPTPTPPTSGVDPCITNSFSAELGRNLTAREAAARGSRNPPAGCSELVRAVDIIDPTLSDTLEYRKHAIWLANGNVVVADPEDSAAAPRAGEFRLYSADGQSIAEFSGDNEDDLIATGLYRLANGNFVVASPDDDVDGVINAGSIRVFSGEDGTAVGAPLVGDNESDDLGEEVLVLNNGNFIVVSRSDDENGVADIGSIRLMSGVDGQQIGATIVGGLSSGTPSSIDVVVLPNDNFVVLLAQADSGTVIAAGVARLFDGETGAQLGDAIAGDQADDMLGSAGITALGTDHYALISPQDDSGVTDGGSVMLLSSTTNTLVGAPYFGDVAGDLSEAKVFSLFESASMDIVASNHYALVAPYDDVGGLEDAGSVTVINGSTNELVGTPVTGDDAGDRLGFQGVINLPSTARFAVASPFDTVAGVAEAGSVKLISSVDGSVIVDSIVGDAEQDSLSLGGIHALPNGNFVVVSPNDDVETIVDAGSVRLYNGDSGEQLFVYSGDSESDQLGKVMPLSNSNFLIIADKNEGDAADTGVIQMVSALNNALLPAPVLAGATAGDLESIQVVELSDRRVAIMAPRFDVNSITDAGMFFVADIDTGAKTGLPISGLSPLDFDSATIQETDDDSYYLLGLPLYDEGDRVDSGRVFLIKN